MKVSLHQISEFCKKHKMAESRFGREAVNDPRLISDLRCGRELTEKRNERIVSYMKEKDSHPISKE